MAFPIFGKKPGAGTLGARMPAQPNDAAPASGLDDEPGGLDFTLTGETRPRKRPRIEVNEAMHEIPQAIEQAAMLYSIEQPEAASAALAEAIHGSSLGTHARRAWGMLFELYQVQGRRPEYEHLAVEFAAKFETSPPAWVAPEMAAKVAPRTPTGGKTSVVLSGTLNAKMQDTLKQALRIAEKNPSVRIDVARITDADEQGCAMLNQVLELLKKARKECAISGAEKLAALLAKKVVPGQREAEPIWLLLLDLHQRMANQEAFEEAAVNYAITFEVSPPSFDVSAAKRPAVVAPKDDPDDEAEGEDSGCALEGVITAGADAALAAVRAEADAADEVVVDVSRVQRMDFVAATNLMNLVSELAARQKRVRLVKASHLLTALWEVIGLDRVARIETRRA